MKKLFASMTAIALVGAMMVPMAAFADQSINIPTGDAPARGIVAPVYTVTIPSVITINPANAAHPETFDVSVPSTNCPLTVIAEATYNGAVKRAAVTLDPEGRERWDVFDEWLETTAAQYALVDNDSYTRFFSFNANGEPTRNGQRGVAQWTKTPSVGCYQGQVMFTIEPMETD